VALTLAVLQFSLRHGRLIVFPTFDDIGYLNDGLHRLQTLYDWGMGGVCSEYLRNPPHSPYSTLLAFAGFSLFGFRDWAPYAMNCLLALGYFLLADRLLRGAALWQKALCFAFIAGIPFVPMAVHEFRPDHAVALFTAAGVLLLLCGPFVHGKPSRRMAAGVLFGIAMLTKPPVFPQTLALGGAALVLATLCDWLAAGRIPPAGKVARAWASVLVPFVLIPLPHYLYNGRAIAGYIYDILFGTYKSSYEMKGHLSDHLLYFLTGNGGEIMLGRHIWVLLAMLAVCGIGVAMLRRRGDAVRGVAMLLMVVAAWLIPTINRTKQEFFGLTFDTLLAFLVVFLLGRLLAAQRWRGGWAKWASAFLLLATVQGTYFFHWPTRYGNLYTGWQANRREIVDGVFWSIVSHSTFGGADVAPAPDTSIPDEDKDHSPTPRVLLCTVGDVNDQLMGYMALKNQVSIQFWYNGSAKTPERFIQDFDGANFIFASESGTGLVADFLPSSPWQDSLLAAVKARHDFKQIGKWTFRKSGKSMYLFMRSAFNGFKPGTGMGAIEGPFPKQPELGEVRWGYGPSSKITVTAAVDGAYDIYWKARSDYQGEVVTLKVDGQEVAQEAVPGSFTEFFDAHIPLQLKAGEHEIEFDYSKWHHDAARPMAVLFQFLQFKHNDPQDGAEKK
jgi:hypothetical protein